MRSRRTKMKKLLGFLCFVCSVLLSTQSWATLGVGITEPVSSVTNSGTSASVTSTNGSSFVQCYASDGAINTPTDSKSNSYTALGTELVLGGGQHGRCYVKHAGTGGASHTFSGSSSGTIISGCIVEVTTTATVSTDQVNRVEDTTSPFLSPGVTTTVANELFVGFGSIEGGADFYVFDVTGGSFTKQDEVTDGNQFYPVVCSTRTVSATGTYNTSMTVSSGLETSSGNWIMTFSEGGGGGPTLPAGSLMLMGTGR